MNRRNIALGAAAALVAGGAVVAAVALQSSDDGDDVPAADYCELAADRVALTEVLDPFTVDVSDQETLRATLVDAQQNLEQAAAAAPDEIEDDYRVVVAAFDEVFSLFEETDFDFEELAATFDPAELDARIDGERVDAAEQAIDAYEAANCAPSSVPSVTVSVGEVAAMIRETFSDEELQVAFDFVGVETVDELAAAILDGKVSLNDLDRVMAGSGVQPLEFGDSPELDVLWEACEAGDDEACDGLYGASVDGSAYRAFAATCGGRADGTTAGECAAES